MAFLTRALLTACMIGTALPAARGAGDDALAARAQAILEVERELVRVEDPAARRDMLRRIEHLERDARRQAREELRREDRQRERERDHVSGARDLRIFEGREVLRLPLERERDPERREREGRRGRDDREVDDRDDDRDDDDRFDDEDEDDEDEHEEEEEEEEEELEEEAEDNEGFDVPSFD